MPLNNNGEPLLGGGSGTSHPPPHASSDILINPHSPSHHTQQSSSHHQTRSAAANHERNSEQMSPNLEIFGHFLMQHKYSQSLILWKNRSLSFCPLYRADLCTKNQKWLPKFFVERPLNRGFPLNRCPLKRAFSVFGE